MEAAFIVTVSYSFRLYSYPKSRELLTQRLPYNKLSVIWDLNGCYSTVFLLEDQ